MFNSSHSALLDFDASVSAIFKPLYNILKHGSSDFEILTFPLTTISLNTALNNNMVKISSQIYLVFTINYYVTSAIFIVVPIQSVSFILGSDWLLEKTV